MDIEPAWARGRFSCPKCDRELSIERLEFDDEGGRESILFIDCPKGDYHVVVTEKDFVSTVTRVVMEGLRQGIGVAASP